METTCFEELSMDEALLVDGGTWQDVMDYTKGGATVGAACGGVAGAANGFVGGGFYGAVIVGAVGAAGGFAIGAIVGFVEGGVVSINRALSS